MTFGADESEVQRLQLELLQEDQLATLIGRDEERNRPVRIDWPEIQLPEDAKPIGQYTSVDENLRNAIQYLYDRGFDPLDSNFWYSPSKLPGRMHNRFIIPFFYKNKIVGYTARWIGNVPEGMPKYFKQTPPKNFVYGLDRQTSDKRTVIVTEGELDAIVTDGIAIGSNNCNDEQANIIDSLHKRVIVLPDADKSSMRLVNKAVERGWEVAFPEWEDCKDAGDAILKYGRLYTVKTIMDSAESSSTKIKILAKKYCQ